MKATAIANSNIALVKYWGKRDKKLMLPQNSSISITLSDLNTVTTVDFNKKYKHDTCVLNNKKLKDGKELDQVVKHLNLIRKMSRIRYRAKVSSKNNFPTAAGLASSASGFAALSLAGSKAAGLNLNPTELSILSRMGSGSATRSCMGGFVEWTRGNKKNGIDSRAKQIASLKHWPNFRIITTIVSTTKKKISSRVGMEQTVKTSPLYPVWLKTIEKDLKDVKQGILKKNLTLVGKTAEQNCLKMHATMMTTQPSLVYWMPATLEIIHAITSWRERGLESYFTIDAGPQVKVICLEKDAIKIKKGLEKIKGVKKTLICKPGDGPKIINKHLF